MSALAEERPDRLFTAGCRRTGAAEPSRQIVFFAVGFETTTPATALAVLHADRLGLENFSLLVAHVRVQPAMEAIMQSGDCRVQGFLAAGHVCAVLGFESYAEFVRRFRVPVVVTGFEPVDLLDGILECVEQLETGDTESPPNCDAGPFRTKGKFLPPATSSTRFSKRPTGRGAGPV